MNTEDFEGYSNQLGVNRVWRAHWEYLRPSFPPIRLPRVPGWYDALGA